MLLNLLELLGNIGLDGKGLLLECMLVVYICKLVNDDKVLYLIVWGDVWFKKYLIDSLEMNLFVGLFDLLLCKLVKVWWWEKC